MPTFHVSQDDISKRSCLRCGAILAGSLYCTQCGYVNNVAQTNISAQETQPSPAFNTVSKDFIPTVIPQAGQYDERAQNASPHFSEYSDIPTQSMPSVTPFLGLASGIPLQAKVASQVRFPLSYSANAASATPFLGLASQSSTTQLSTESSFTQSAEQDDVTQPTLIIPVGKREEPARQGVGGQIVRRKGSSLKRLLTTVIIVIILVGGSTGGYLFLKRSTGQRSGGVASTSSFSHPRGPLRFVETFKNNDNQWDLQSQAGKYTVAITKGSLILEDDANTLLPELLPGNRTFSNFKMDVDAVLSKGDVKNGYGVYIRCAADQDGSPATYYRFEFYGDSIYAIFKGILNEQRKADANPLKVMSYTKNVRIQKQGSVNHIEILAQGPSMILSVNGQVLKIFSDSSYTKGTIGLFISNVQNTSPGAQAKFSNLTIDPKE